MSPNKTFLFNPKLSTLVLQEGLRFVSQTSMFFVELALVDVLGDSSTDNEAELSAEFVDLGVGGLVDELELELSSSSLTTCSRRFLHRSNRSRAVMAGIKMLTKSYKTTNFSLTVIEHIFPLQ